MDDPTDVIGFCLRVRPRLVGTLSLLCGDGDTAEKLAQETLARVWPRWSRVRELDEPLAIAWTYRVGIDLANSWLRRRTAERRAHARLPARRSPPSPATTGPGWCCATTRTCRVAEVAALMGCAPGTVKSLTSKALTAVRRVEGVQVAEEVTDGS